MIIEREYNESNTVETGLDLIGRLEWEFTTRKPADDR
jgi:hypothetical protein